MIPALAHALFSGLERLEDRQECGDDVPLTRVHMVEDDGRIRRMERQQAHDRHLPAAARPRALFLSIAPDGVVAPGLRIVDIAVLGQHNTPLQGAGPFVALAFEEAVGTIRDLRLHGMPDHLGYKHARSECPPRRHAKPHLRFNLLALNKGACHSVQSEQRDTRLVLVSRAWHDLADG